MTDSIGDQHKPNGDSNSVATSNPFEPPQQRITEYTAQEIAVLQSRLEKQLGPEYISARPGAAGQKVHYLAAEKAISLANEIFGFNGWSSSIQNIQIDFVDENTQTGKISLGLSVIVRVTLKDGCFHEDVGYGHIENCKGKAAAFEKAKKEGTTDAMKRALRTFGNVLGNCLYDKDFLGRVTKVKMGKPSGWSEENLHRHSNYAATKNPTAEDFEDMKTMANLAAVSSTTEAEDSFGMDDFDDADFGESGLGNPDEVTIPVKPTIASRASPPKAVPQQMKPPVGNDIYTPPNAPNTRTVMAPPAARKTPQAQTVISNNPEKHYHALQPPQQAAQISGQQSCQLQNDDQKYASDEFGSSPVMLPEHFDGPPNPPQPEIPPHALGVNFYSARVAESVGASNTPIPGPNAIPAFNPKTYSPSIRKTAGVNHNASIPVKLDKLKNVPSRDFVNPRADDSRRLGLPGGGTGNVAGQNVTEKGGGGTGSNAFRPPSRRAFPADASAVLSNHAGPGAGIDQAMRRPPLGDVSNVPYQRYATATTDNGTDAKRQKLADWPADAGADGAVGVENTDAPPYGSVSVPG